MEPAQSGEILLPFLRRKGAFEQRLAVLMASRLVLSLVSLGIALGLDTAVGEMLEQQRWGLYGTVSFAFLATALYGLILPRIQRPARFAGINIAADISIVSALVYFSGGADSVFAFLYVMVAVYGALLFERRGALISAGFGALAYGVVLLAGNLAWLNGAPGTSEKSVAALFAVWTIHSGAIGLVAALASFLAAELRRTGEALQYQTDRLERLANLHERTVESLMSGLLTTNSTGSITSFNPEAERITEVLAAEAIGSDVESVLPGVRSLMVERADSENARIRSRTTFRSRSGIDLHLGVAAYVLRDTDSQAGGHVVIFQDLTEVVKMEAELRRSERLAAVGELASSIAHEIRNPLAAISGSIQILQRGKTDASLGKESLRLMDIAIRETDRLDRLITDFLVYARPGPLASESVDLLELLNEVVEMLGKMVSDDIQLEVEVESGLRVMGDPGQLKQVVWNLALNGVQAMPKGGKLQVEARSLPELTPQEPLSEGRSVVEEKGAWVEIVVHDQGGGISPEAVDHIFDPFFTTKPEGSGLGLATVHRIVAEHGGSIGLETSKQGGTEIHVRLPRGEA
ncbi:MAG: PAS domain-containing protein [Myxococcales bacterium]|nr:PAS domain-containing protein [Myxococcales bacterium]